jgi:hypothetical protein
MKERFGRGKQRHDVEVIPTREHSIHGPIAKGLDYQCTTDSTGQAQKTLNEKEGKKTKTPLGIT